MGKELPLLQNGKYKKITVLFLFIHFRIELLVKNMNSQLKKKRKKKLAVIFLIINTILIIFCLFPVFGEIYNITSNLKSVITKTFDNTDGPTVIFISSPINWYLITIAGIELILALYLLLTHTSDPETRIWKGRS